MMWTGRIPPVDREALHKCEEKWLTIAKPLYSLGTFEQIISQIGAIRKNEAVPLDKRCAIICCADNGVVCEGVSQTDASVTRIVADNLAEGRANLNIISRNCALDVMPVDMGMKYAPLSDKVVDCCIRRETGNIRIGPAMTRQEAVYAIEAGIRLAESAVIKDYDILVTGEMGIGNTTTASACAAVLLGLAPKQVTGRGAGLSDEGLHHKIEVIQDAIAVNRPDRTDALDVLSKLGGFDIAGMTGVFLGGGIYGRPVIIDGFISSVAAMLAVMLEKNTREYMIASHISREPAGKRIMEHLALSPVIDGGLALGEGTGAACLLPLLDMVHEVYAQNVTFDDIHMEAYKKF